MEMWLNQADTKFQFPVFPSEFEINGSAITNTSNILNKGEILIFGGRGLRNTEVSSFFPNKYQSYCAYKNLRAPYDCADLLESWRKKGLILRFIITETNVNFECMIEDFKYGKKDGTKDVYFTLSLKEYDRFTIPKVNQSTGTKDREADKKKANNYYAMAGETLYQIAKYWYDDGEKYLKLAEINGIKDPSAPLKKDQGIYIPESL